MNLFDFIPAPYRWLAGGIAILAALALLGYGVHRYNESVREPLKREIKFLEDSIEAQKKQAAAKYAQLEKERDQAAENWRKYVRNEQDGFDSQMRAAVALHDAGSVRFTDPAGRGCSGGSPETKAEGSAPVPANPATGSELSEELTALLRAEALRADQAAIYAAAARGVALECLSK